MQTTIATLEFSLDDVKTVIEILQGIVTTVGILIGGIWAYWTFYRRREHHLRVEFSVDFNVVGMQDDQYIVEAIAFIENKGLVRHLLTDFSINLRYLEAKDSVKEGENVNRQIDMPHKIGTRSMIPRDSLQKGESQQLTHPNKGTESEWGYTFIEPNVKQKYSYITSLPSSATFAMVYAKFKYPDKDQDFHTAQGLFKLPDSRETPEGEQDNAV